MSGEATGGLMEFNGAGMLLDQSIEYTNVRIRPSKSARLCRDLDQTSRSGMIKRMGRLDDTAIDESMKQRESEPLYFNNWRTW
jgi:hypothetical protein